MCSAHTILWCSFLGRQYPSLWHSICLHLYRGQTSTPCLLYLPVTPVGPQFFLSSPVSLSLFPFLSSASLVGSLHHHQGLSIPRRSESGFAFALSALVGTETPDAQRGGRQGERSVCPSDFHLTRNRLPSIAGEAPSWITVTVSPCNLSRQRHLFSPRDNEGRTLF